MPNICSTYAAYQLDNYSIFLGSGTLLDFVGTNIVSTYPRLDDESPP